MGEDGGEGEDKGEFAQEGVVENIENKEDSGEKMDQVDEIKEGEN